MADSPISGRPAASALTGAELLAGVQSGVTVKITVAQIKALLDAYYLAQSVASAFGLTLIGSANASAAQSNLALVPGTNVQAYSALLAAVAGLTSAADTMPYFSGSNAASTTALTAAARNLLAATNQSGQQSALGLGSAALLASSVLAQLANANVFTNVQAVTPYRANISGAVSIDLANTAKSNNLHLTLTGNVTSFALTNPVDGAVYNIRLIRGASGYTFAGLSSAFKFANGTAPVWSTAANSVDFISAEWGASEATYMAAALIGMA